MKANEAIIEWPQCQWTLLGWVGGRVGGWSPSAVAADESFLASPFAWVGEGAAGAEAEAVGGSVWTLRQQQAAELPELGPGPCAPRRIGCEAS